MSNAVLGGWSPYTKPTEEELKIFEEATSGLIGVEYTPLEVSSQVVAGMNYRFLCNARPVIVAPIEYKATVQIHAPLEGKPFVTSITPH